MTKVFWSALFVIGLLFCFPDRGTAFAWAPASAPSIEKDGGSRAAWDAGFSAGNGTMRLISGDELVERAKEFLLAQPSLASERRAYTLDFLNRPNDISVPAGDVSYEYKLPYGIKYGFPTNISVLVFVDGQLYKKTMVRIKIHLFEPVVVAARLLNAKQVIRDEDVRLEKMDITKVGHYYFTDKDKVVGMVLKRVVNTGAMINALMIEKPVIVERMAMVRIVSEHGGIKVEMEGQALQDGREGDIIRVKNIRSNRVVNGRVIDAATVEVSAR